MFTQYVNEAYQEMSNGLKSEPVLLLHSKFDVSVLAFASRGAQGSKQTPGLLLHVPV